MLPPIAYLTLSRIQAEKLRVQYVGGRGSSPGDAIRIEGARSTDERRAAAYAWLADLEERHGERFELLGLEVVERNGCHYDRFELTLGVATFVVYFDAEPDGVGHLEGRPSAGNDAASSGPDENPLKALLEQPDPTRAEGAPRKPFLALFEESDSAEGTSSGRGPFAAPDDDEGNTQARSSGGNPFAAIVGDKGKAPSTSSERDASGEGGAGGSEGREALEAALAELDALVGLAPVKRKLRSVVNRLIVGEKRRRAGLASPPASLHMIFHGPPGTGKTTVARILARTFGALGLLEQGHLVETDRSGLVAAYVGQTAPQTARVCEQAMGGLLLVDEAYALVADASSPNDFGREALVTLMKQMEDHQGRFAVVFSGYTHEMQRFSAANPGLLSRIGNVVGFPEYSADELVAVLKKSAQAYGFRLEAPAFDKARGFLAARRRARKESFGHAREVRLLLEIIQQRQADRLVRVEAPGREALSTVLAQDVPEPEGRAEEDSPGQYL